MAKTIKVEDLIITPVTDKELAILSAMDNSEYGDHLREEIWTFSVEYNQPKEGVQVKGKEISGTISSLKKKGLVFLGHSDGNDTIGMTDKGIIAYVHHRKGITNKNYK